MTGLNHTYQTGSSMSGSANIALFVHRLLQVCPASIGPRTHSLRTVYKWLHALGDIISAHRNQHHQNADDTQLFFSLTGCHYRH